MFYLSVSATAASGPASSFDSNYKHSTRLGADHRGGHLLSPTQPPRITLQRHLVVKDPEEQLDSRCATGASDDFDRTRREGLAVQSRILRVAGPGSQDFHQECFLVPRRQVRL